jgi:hypothetical protein
MFLESDRIAVICSLSGNFAHWHAFCLAPLVLLPLSANRSAEVFIVDTPSAAGHALAAARTDAESTHVLCRHADESTPDFTRRVLRRLERIQRGRRVRSLWYVVGAEAAGAAGSALLLAALRPWLESGACLTVVGPGSSQHALFDWIDGIMDSTLNDVSVRAQLYADDAEIAVPRRSPNRAESSPAPAAFVAALARTRWPWPAPGADIIGA